MARRPGESFYLPTTQIWDVASIESMDVTSQDFKELIIRLYQNLNLMANAINSKEYALYDTLEGSNGQMFFPNPAYTPTTNMAPNWRPVYRTVVNFGALPNTATKNVAHNLVINPSFSCTRLYGCATDPVNKVFLPLPFSSPVLVDNILLQADNTNVTVTTGIDYSMYDVTYIVLEYIKN
jgi:hypothetical protein